MNKLSIITINLNNSFGLLKTIKSVVGQTYPNFEYIIVDGASTDTSIKTIQQFNSSSIQQFSWISETDSGVYEAMNKGIRMAKGEYLLFLNSGDFLVNKNVLSKVFSENKTSDILCGRCNISEKGKIIHTTNPPNVHTFSTYFNGTINHQSTFIKRSLFKNFGFYREDFKYNSDWEFWIRTIILNNCTTEKIDIVICEYNLDGISSKQNNTESYFKEIKNVLSHPLLQKFVPDYEQWNKEKDEMAIMYWVKTKKILYLPLVIIYKLAFLLVSKKKRTNN